MSAESRFTGEESKRAAIHAAAIDAFSSRGLSGTSMAHIAEAAGMSRPALYQYFRNKGDIFASAFYALIDDAADRSLAALNEPGSVAEQLDGFLQRFDGDLWERTAASPYGDEIMTAKSEYAPEAMGVVMARLRKGLESYLKRACLDRGKPSTRAAIGRSGWLEMLELSPKGFKFDRPAVGVYRRRLSSLARTVASDLEAS